MHRVPRAMTVNRRATQIRLSMAVLLIASLCHAYRTVADGIPASMAVTGADPENCLSCHRFAGLSRYESETDSVRFFSCDNDYYAHAMGPHSRIKCTGCHERDEVAMIPHEVKTPVDCAKTCHLQDPLGMTIEFSHRSVSRKMEAGVHSGKNLRELDLGLLAEGQSECLYCHDQPHFRVDASRPTLSESGKQRCDSCHAEVLPLDAEYFTKHVFSRTKPARTVRSLVQVCAVCHSDHDVLAHTGRHDAVASYLHSFHGKAALLGSTESANCLDCHAAPGHDVHAMLAHDNPLAPVSDGRIATTCRTTDCHPGASPNMSVAAVHLDLDPVKPTVEYGVAAMFIALTAGVMFIYFMLILLELINTMIRRDSDEHRKLVQLARLLQQHPDGRKLLYRFTPHERVQHWFLAIFFILLVITGMPIKFADATLSEWTVVLLGGLTSVRILHRVAGVILIVVFAYHIVYLLYMAWRHYTREKASGRPHGIINTLLAFPMVVTPRDVKQFIQLFAYLLFLRKHRPAFGKFNFMEKFEYWAVFWGMPIMGLSGAALWAAQWVTLHVSGRFLNFAYIIHSDESFLAFIYIAVVHMYSVILAPSVFPLSRGTMTGLAPPSEMAEGHRELLERSATELGLRVDTLPDSAAAGRIFGSIVKRVYSLGLFCVVTFVFLSSMQFLAELMWSGQHVPAKIVEIPRRLDQKALLAASTAELTPGDGLPRRAPLSHFHALPKGLQFIESGCSTTGCHGPLPHAERIEVRAFLNMHSTFVDCMVCHTDGTPENASVAWHDAESGDQVDQPAILAVSAMLAGKRPEDIDVNARGELSAQLGRLLQRAADDLRRQDIRRWALEIETTHIEGELWESTFAGLQRRVSEILQGSYGHVLRLNVPDDKDDSRRALTMEWLAAKDGRDAARQDELLDRIHEGVASKGLMCTPCHAPESTLIDFGALGYPEARIRGLTESTIVDQVLSIENGRVFHLPGFLEPEGAD